MQNAPIFVALENYKNKNMSRFHTPGHSGKSQLPWNIMPFDATEIDGLDSLYEASGVIAEAETLASDFFGAEQTLFSAGGCTLAIQTMILLAMSKSRKKKIVVGRNAHVSVINACALLRLEPIFIYPENGEILSDDVESVIDDDVGAVIITSPDYYGVLSDISAISAVCKKHEIPLLCDNAHGTHLIFFGLHPLTLGADMTACSAHKTLPVLTGGAFLNLAAYHENAKQCMSIFGSTSPSYPVLASLDLAREYCQVKGKEDFLKLKDRVDKTKDYAEKCGLITVSGDPVRITLDTGNHGKAAGKILRENGVEPEFCDDRYAILIATPFHDEEDFKKVERAISMMPYSEPKPRSIIKSQSKIPLYQAITVESEWVSTDCAVGRIAASMVNPCPPGIPIVMPGEYISKEIVEFIKNSRILSLKVIK